MLPSEGWISPPQTQTHTRSKQQAASQAMSLQPPVHRECGTRWEQQGVEGITQGRWVHAGPGGTGWGRGELSGDFQHWAGENRQEAGNSGWAKPCGMTPRKGVNITGIWRHQRWFSTAGSNSWISLLCRLWGCTVAEMGTNYLLDIPNPCGLARGYCRQAG